MAQTQNYTVGRGKVYYAPFRPGTTRPAGWEYIGHTTELGISATTEKLDHWNMDSKRKRKDKTVTLSAEFAMTFSTDHISPNNVARFFLSDGAQTVSQAAAASVNQTITGIELDRYYTLGDSDGAPMGVKELESVTVAIGGTDLEPEIDFIADLVNGTVYFVEGGAATAGADAVITYGVRASTFDRVLSGDAEVRGALKFVSDNATGDNFTMLAPCVEISPNGDYALKGDEWQVLSFNVSVLELDDRAALYRDGRPEVV